MTHNHHRDHDHHDGKHDHCTGEMPMAEKLTKMISHWLKHNADHASTYRQWAQRARDAGMEDVAEILESVAEESQAINADLERAGKVLQEKH